MTNSKGRIVAIITARGGSKGIPGKNIVQIKSKPLLLYTIEAAIASSKFDAICVTTDDEEISEIAKQSEVLVVQRPKELAEDDSSSLDAIRHALITLAEGGQHFEYFMLLQPTSPLRNKDHINEAIDLYMRYDEGSLVSVKKSTASPYKMLVQKDDRLEPLMGWCYMSMPRQKLPMTYEVNGAIYFSKTRLFLEKNSLYVEPLKIYEMGRRESLDIDSYDDLMLFEFYLQEAG